MSWFDETISDDSFQASNGAASDTEFNPLRAVRDIVAHRCVYIINNDFTNLRDLIITSTNTPGSTSPFNYHLAPGKILKLELRRPAAILVRGVGGVVQYSWMAM